ncbi:MAG TPA: hypothetical protein VLA16_17935 [Ideonella sp.]|nr:hypothetical protein [Ideonella sp.]
MNRPSDKLETRKILKDGSLKPKTIDKLDAGQKAWSQNVMRALGLKSTSSQARVLSGGIASAAVVEAKGSDKDKATARQLRAKVVAAGNPPWKDAGKAMAATSAKVHLDILSMPADERQLKPLGADKQGIHQAFWIDRRDPDDDTDHAFLCKPANKLTADEIRLLRGGKPPLADSGGPRGGEVAREALSGRTAQLLASQTGIDIGMPETHVVALDRDMIPGSDPTGPAQLTCSVQEARAASGDLTSLAGIQKATLSADQVAGLAIFDTLTLNTDRHPGNVLTDGKGNVIPIDHGESFAEPNETGVNRIKATLGSPHNALLALPGAHSPMSRQMLKKLKALDADKFASGLKKDNQMIGAQHADMKDAVSPEAIDTSRRAAVFVKLAAKNAVPLSPAAIQVAMGNAADRLFGKGIDEKTFLKTAKEVIARAAPQQQAIKEVCTSSSVEYDTLIAQADALGWSDVFSQREGAPDVARCGDPIVLLTIIKRGLKAPKKFSEMQAKIKEIQEEPQAAQLSPADAMDAIATARQETIQRLMVAMSRPSRAEIANRMVEISSRKLDDRLHSQSLLIATATRLATDNQQARLAAFKLTHRIDDLIREELMANPTTLNSIKLAAASLTNADPLRASSDIDAAEASAKIGQFLPDASDAVGKKLREMAQTLLIPANDDDLKEGQKAAKAQDPFVAKQHLVSLVDRHKKGEFIDEPLKVIQAELDALNANFTLDPSSQYAAAAAKALNDKNPLMAEAAMYELRNTANRGALLPSAKHLDRLIEAIGAKDDDPDLATMRKAFADNDVAKFESSLGTLKKRAKTGNLDDAAAARKVQQRLDTVLAKFQVPADAPDVFWTLYGLKAGNERDLVSATACVSRLEARAKAGAYPPVQKV